MLPTLPENFDIKEPVSLTKAKETHHYPTIKFKDYETFLEFKKYDKTGVNGVSQAVCDQWLKDYGYTEEQVVQVFDAYTIDTHDCFDSFYIKNSSWCLDVYWGEYFVEDVYYVVWSDDCHNCKYGKGFEHCQNCYNTDGNTRNYVSNSKNCDECEYINNCEGCKGVIGIDYFTREENQKNCESCKNCEGCNGCKNCENCLNCVDCINCKGVDTGAKSSNLCENCLSCNSCVNCSDCISCNSCTKCDGCEDCKNCEECNTVYNCEDCKELENEAHLKNGEKKDLKKESWMKSYFYYVN